MKKVLVLASVLVLLASHAMGAGILNTKHNLSNTNLGTQTFVSTSEDELCIFCHTPHGGATVQDAPLWNRSLGSIGVGNLYNSTTLSSATAPSTITVNGLEANTDVLLCLSCHDGATMAGGLINPSENGQPTFTAAQIQNDPATYKFTNIGGRNGDNVAARGASDLRDDHPIGMVYADVVTAKGTTEFVAANDAAVAPLLRNTRMWCSSCHDVHDNTVAPFLRVSNAGSNLCLTCHVK